MRLLLLFFSLLLNFSLEAAEWYVKPSGSGGQSGADIDNAIGQGSVNAASSAGDTWRMLGGYGNFSSIYCTKADVKILSCDDLGYTNKWSAQVVGSAGTHGIYTGDNIHGVTIWGMRVLSSYIDGIKNNGNRATNIDNWISNAGRGDPNWNTGGSYRGNGIAFHSKSDFHIERNLIENCGAMPTQDHGMYGNGTNGVIRGNICRTNQAWGIQVADVTGDNDNVLVEGNLVHDNGYTGTSQSGIVFQTHGNKTNNKIRNNTVIARSGKYAIISYADHASARLTIVNNILKGDAGYGIIVPGGGSSTNTVISDNNLKSSIINTEPQGDGDVAGSATFDSEANARYWLTSGSLGRNMADAAQVPLIDFWGRAQTSATDVGIAQYDVQLDTDDSRNLGDGAQDPWVREPKPFAVTQGVSNMQISWTEINQHAPFYYIQRKDSVGNTYGVIGTAARGVTTYNDPLSSLTNGLTYTYTATPETTLGNSGGIHSIPVAMVYAAPVISSLTSLLVTETTARITWTTDTAATARVTYNGGTLSTNDANLATSHLINLTGLSAGTLYTYSAISSNSGGTTTSSPLTFTTDSGTVPAPVISSLTSSAITATSATITWTTDELASARVTYNGSLSTNDANLATSHSIFLTSLTPSLLYTYTASSVNAGGTTVSQPLTFTTLALSVPPPPVGDLTVAATIYIPAFSSSPNRQRASSGASPLRFTDDSTFSDFLPKTN